MIDNSFSGRMEKLRYVFGNNPNQSILYVFKKTLRAD
jgi:hypothetical protein